MNKLIKVFERLVPLMIVLAISSFLILESFAVGRLIAWLVGGSSILFGSLWLLLSVLAIIVVLGSALKNSDDF